MTRKREMISDKRRRDEQKGEDKNRGDGKRGYERTEYKRQNKGRVDEMR